MSTGERSCVNFGKCTIPSINNINSNCCVDCDTYQHDGKTTPDTKPKNEVVEINEAATVVNNVHLTSQKLQQSLQRVSMSKIKSNMEERILHYQIQKGWSKRKARRKVEQEVIHSLSRKNK